MIPKISQKFDSLDEAHLFYNNYARESGFSTRINSSKKNKQGEIIRKEYVCYKEGVRSEKYTQQNSGKVIRKIGLTRVGCGARMHVVKDRTGEGFVVIQFEPGHNHPLTTPKKVHLLRSHRGVSHAKKALTRQLGGANVSIPQQMSLFEMEAGGLENVGCSLQDLYNAERDRRKMLEGHDANLLFEHFENEKHKNSSFMYSMEKDDEGMMTDCFWADATCRKSYQYFGDVVVFDTTYNTNRYNLIFAPILGVNHHGQTTLFGCAFLKHEKFENFEWLLKVWLNAMPAGPPKMIITDQCPAMTKAISFVLPNVLHRYCIWHIVSKFSEKIGALAYKQHYEEFKKCIWKSESPGEFEESWLEVVQKANLSTNEWLDVMYKIRERWVPAYTRNIFSAHMTSSQRAESSHNFFKRYVSRENTMLDFVTRFNRALSHVRHKELDLDHKDVNESPLLKTPRVMEKKMSELYTRHVFYKFQAEVFQSSAYVLTRIFKDEHRELAPHQFCLWNFHLLQQSHLASITQTNCSQHYTNNVQQ